MQITVEAASEEITGSKKVWRSLLLGKDGKLAVRQINEAISPRCPRTNPKQRIAVTHLVRAGGSSIPALGEDVTEAHKAPTLRYFRRAFGLNCYYFALEPEDPPLCLDPHYKVIDALLPRCGLYQAACHSKLNDGVPDRLNTAREIHQVVQALH
jgi:hypothetical protein